MEATAKTTLCCGNNSDSETEKCSDNDFGTSKLGTKEYLKGGKHQIIYSDNNWNIIFAVLRSGIEVSDWEDTYQRELDTFKDVGDVGEIWFGEESMSRVLRWMDKEKIPHSAAILDIGTGNGVFLTELAKHGYSNLTGIDYSLSSVELARNVLQAENLTDVSVKEVDFLNCHGELKDFDICIDKGTFDAISLNPENTKEGKLQYVQALKDVLKDKGLFAITSCNWTKEQLLDRFSEGFEFVQELPTPSFHFGGKKGNSVTALIFKRAQ